MMLNQLMIDPFRRRAFMSLLSRLLNIFKTPLVASSPPTDTLAKPNPSTLRSFRMTTPASLDEGLVFRKLSAIPRTRTPFLLTWSAMRIYLSGELKVFLEFASFSFLSHLSENFISLPALISHLRC